MEKTILSEIFNFKLEELVVNQGLIGIVAKKEQIFGEAITDFTIINKILHEFIWVHFLFYFLGSLGILVFDLLKK